MTPNSVANKPDCIGSYGGALCLARVVPFQFGSQENMAIRLALLLLLFASHLASSQTMFHGNAAHGGVYDALGPKQFGGIKWTFKTGGPIVASPAVADGVVYIARMDSYLSAIDQEAGKEKWKYKSRMPIASSPAIAGGHAYFVSSAGALGAIEVSSGKIRWVLPTEYERCFGGRSRLLRRSQRKAIRN